MERTVENIRRIRGIVSISFFSLIVIVGIGAAIYSTQTGEITIGIPLGEAVIGIATLILAFATFYLALSEMIEGIETRENNEKIAEKDRRRLRLKEQLEGLYSPLMAELNKIDDTKIYGTQWVKTELLQIFDKYKHILEFLGSDPLRDKIIGLYEMSPKVVMGFSKNDWDGYANELIEIIIEDNNSLMKEYNELTK